MLISIDTNVLIAFLVPPSTDLDVAQQTKANAVLEAVSNGTTRAIVSEIVLHESYYVLVMRGEMLSVNEFCEIFRDILSWPGWAIDERELGIYFRGLELVEAHPKLEFSDAVIAARAEHHEAQLATFDRRLAKAYGGTIWAES